MHNSMHNFLMYQRRLLLQKQEYHKREIKRIKKETAEKRKRLVESLLINAGESCVK